MPELTRPPLPRSRGPVLAAALLALLLGTGPARADVIVLKDGTVLQGRVLRHSKVEIDPVSHDAVIIPEGFFLVDDGPRRIYFSPSQVRIVEKKEPPPEERFVDDRTIAIPAAHGLPAFKEFLRADPWSPRWERTVHFRGPTTTVSVPQHLGLLGPYYSRADATKYYAWSAYYLTRELGLERVQKLLASPPKVRDKKELTTAEKAALRFRIFDFYTQAGWLDEADKVAAEILKDYPDQRERAETARAGLARMRARERFEDVKRLHLAGRYQAVRQELAAFPEKDASETTLADFQAFRADYESASDKLAEVRRRLAELARGLKDDRHPGLATAVAALQADLELDHVPRLEAFLGQARQAERLQKDGKAPEIGPGELLSLAVTGWLLGNSSAESKPDTALRLWHARQVVLDYQKAEAIADRKKILQGYQQGSSRAAPLDEITQLIPQLPPPEPETRLDPAVPLVYKLGEGRRAANYEVQLPPEYRHSRAYPVLIALHQAGEKPRAMLQRWREAAADNGYLVAAPDWEEGLSGRYNYSEREHAVVLDTLRDLRRRFQVDSDRVFLFGLGEGANMAFDVGLAHPDLFAGVLPMGGGPELFAKACWRNGQYLPFYVVNGDRGGEDNKNIREEFEKWVLRGYPMVWMQYKGRGVEWFAGEVPALFDWMRHQHRAFPLRQLGTDGGGQVLGNEFYTMRGGENRFYWLTTDSIQERSRNDPDRWNANALPATLTARIDPASDPRATEIYVKTYGVRQLTLWLGRNGLGEGMVDFDKPVAIKVNLQLKWNGRVTPSLETLLEDLHDRGDRQRLFLARVDLKL